MPGCRLIRRPRSPKPVRSSPKYESRGQRRERILIKIAATWEVESGRRPCLEREGIHCNLTLLFGLHQAIACAEAGVTLISPFVGRIWTGISKTRDGLRIRPPKIPGVRSVADIYNYYKHFGYRTEVMGATSATWAKFASWPAAIC